MLASRRIYTLAIVLVSVTALSGCDSIELLDNRMFDTQVEVIRSLRADLQDRTAPELQIVGIDERTLQSVDCERGVNPV